MTSSGADRAGSMPKKCVSLLYGDDTTTTLSPKLSGAITTLHFVWRCRNADFFVDARITLRIGRKFFFVGAPRSDPSLSVDIQS